MKKNDVVKAYREKSKEEILTEIREIKQRIFSLGIQKFSDSLEKTHLIRVEKKNMARIMTVLTEKQVG